MSRLSPLNPDAMNDAQRSVMDKVAAGPRGRFVGGPIGAWLHSPELADRAQHLGAFCRYETALPKRLSELAILITAKNWRAQYEWYAHEPMARDGGLDNGVIASIKAGTPPNFTNADEEAIYNLGTELYRNQRVSDATYAAAVAELGETGVVEVVGIMGYYALVSMTLNTFQVALPEGEPLPFPE